MKILMVAAECGALPGGKVGGMGDVLAEVPPALSAAGHDVHVVLPSYGVFHVDAPVHLNSAARFAGTEQKFTLYRLPDVQPGVHHWVIDHPVFASPAGKIYHHDGAGAPFSTDGNLYALFSAAVARCLSDGAWGEPDVLHLHDWHAAGVLLFRDELPVRRTVFTIHNLGLQGQRPLQGHPSAFASWFPEIDCPPSAIDPRFPDCYNPMRFGICASDRVHVVSPTYAREVVQPDGDFLHGGEGLEADLQAAEAQGRLIGILNGCAYSEAQPPRIKLLDAVSEQLRAWIAGSDTVPSTHGLALRNVDNLRRKRKPLRLITSVTRVTDQKVQLLRTAVDDEGTAALDRLLASLSPYDAYVLLGSGDPDLERFLVEVSARHENFVFLNGYSEHLADPLYAQGDVFLMPSTYEPCGISQMLAMAQGQPCIVHAVGGLADTVRDGVDGFVFSGRDAVDAARAMLQRTDEALAMQVGDPDAWVEVCRQARGRRFLWADTAEQYGARLYS